LSEFVAALIDLYLPRPSRAEEREGQSLVEYALIIVLIAIAIIVAMTALSGQIQNVFNRISSSLGA
jgi:pilus assembly protein Flp/PilA